MPPVCEASLSAPQEREESAQCCPPGGNEFGTGCTIKTDGPRQRRWTACTSRATASNILPDGRNSKSDCISIKLSGLLARGYSLEHIVHEGIALAALVIIFLTIFSLQDEKCLAQYWKAGVFGIRRKKSGWETEAHPQAPFQSGCSDTNYSFQ